MKSERVLLISHSNERYLYDKLAAILSPHFTLETISTVDNSPCSHTFEKTLELINPTLIVIAFADESTFDRKAYLKAIKQCMNEVPLMVAIESVESEEIIDLLRCGAGDFVVAPMRASEVVPRAWRLIKTSELNSSVRMDQSQSGFRKLIGQSVSFVSQTRRIPAIAKCDANVLIAGETGTGKELYARAIHYSSSRRGRAFMPVNCGAIPVDLVENELFGHERGAFTSALSLQSGLIDEANGGTLFLDEIDCLPLSAQVKLLRFLQEKEYRPLGSAKLRRADVRVIAASNLNLEEAVGNGKLRQDLFYRLNVISLLLPPLRERRDDIVLLAHHFIDKYSREFAKETSDLSDDALTVLLAHDWPGNVRELEHVIERAIVMCEGMVLRASDLELPSMVNGRQESLQEAKAKEIARFERNYIQGLLTACKGNITRAAQAAQKNRRAFWQLIQKHQIDVAKFKPAR